MLHCMESNSIWLDESQGNIMENSSTTFSLGGDSLKRFFEHR